MSDAADLAKKEFRKALRAHVRAVKRAVATDAALGAATNRLYDTYVQIGEEYRAAGFNPDDLVLPLRMRDAAARGAF